MGNTICNGCARPVLARRTLDALEARAWWGIVRELRNALEHAVILARGGPLLPEHLPPPAPPAHEEVGCKGMLAALVRKWTEAQLLRNPQANSLYSRFMALVERPLLETVLERHHEQYAAAARQLKLHRITLKRKLQSPP